jgi:flagellar basal-body rod protein FlgF
MTDKAVFIGMTGAKSAMQQLGIVTNNLANVNTTGFRADYEVLKQHPVSDDAKQTRVYSDVDSGYTDFKHGPTLNTGRDLDVAISGEGFFAVQSAKTGKEAYTRAGSFQIVDNKLYTRSGDIVLGIGGPISLPPAERMNIAADGKISAKITGQTEMIDVDKIRLTNPATSTLHKGEDGLFYPVEGTTVTIDNNIRIIHGALEGSNVNAIDTLTKLIDLSRHFEVHTNLMKKVEDNADKANELLQNH